MEMYVMPRFLALLVCLPLAAAAQMTISQGTVQAIGSATISVPPDQAQLDVGVVTQAATAQDAGQQNATLTTTVLNALKGVLSTVVVRVAFTVTTTVLNALKGVLGTAGTIQTV